MKRLVSFLFAIAFAIAAVGPANAIAWDFPLANTVPFGTTMVAVNEPSHFDSWNSWYSIKKGDFKGFSPEGHICPNGIDNADCDPNNYHVSATSILPVCDSESAENCVVGLRFSTSTSAAVSAKFIKMVEGRYYEGDADQNLIGGAGVSLWEVDSFTHSGGSSNYSVIVKLNQQFDEKLGKFTANSITANVMPYSIRAGGTPPDHKEQASPDGIVRVYTNHDNSCAWTGNGYCGQAEDFVGDVRVELEIRLPKSITGWFRGRLKGPDANIQQFSATNSTYIISGEPVVVPRVAAYVTADNISEETKTALQKMGGKNPGGPLFEGNAIRDAFSNQGPTVFKLIDGVRNATKDTAAGISTLWNFSTIENSGNNKCLNDNTRVLGIVTTNATAYEGTPPKFTNGQLTYQVSGVHYEPDGLSANLGTYDLIMRSEVARCLYGFSNAPVSATIAVQNEAGSVNVATKVVNEKDGWLKLAAYGFTFSTPKISIKLTQAKKNISITCVKGKNTKKVSGTSPKCPAGYKRKA